MAVVTIQNGNIIRWETRELAYSNFVNKYDEGSRTIASGIVQGETICMDRPYGLVTLLKANIALASTCVM